MNICIHDSYIFFRFLRICLDEYTRIFYTLHTLYWYVCTHPLLRSVVSKRAACAFVCYTDYAKQCLLAVLDAWQQPRDFSSSGFELMAARSAHKACAGSGNTCRNFFGMAAGCFLQSNSKGLRDIHCTAPVLALMARPPAEPCGLEVSSYTAVRVQQA